MKKGLGFLLRLAVSLAAIGGLAYALRGKFGESLQIFQRGIHWPWLLVGIAFFILGTALISWRLQMIFKVQEVKVSFLETFYLSILGLFFSLFFPSALGGDVAKGYFAYQYSGKKLGSLTGVLLDRMLGLVTMVGITVVAATFYSHQLEMPALKRSLYGFMGLLIVGTVFLANHQFAQKFQFLSFLIPSSKLRAKLGDLYHALREYRNHGRVLVNCCIISLVAQLFFLTQSYFLTRSLGISISLWPFLVLMPLVAFASMAPSLSGLGVREAGFVFFFKNLIPAEQAFAVSLLYDFVFYGCALLGGLVFAFRGGLKKELLAGLEAVEEQEA